MDAPSGKRDDCRYPPSSFLKLPGAGRIRLGAGGKKMRFLETMNCASSALLLRKDKNLAGINATWIADLVLVRFVNDCVSHTVTVDGAANAPETVAPRYNRGRDLGHDHHRGWASV